MDSIEKQIYLDALELWGEDMQLRILQGECAEVISAVCDLARWRYSQATLASHLAEELADVEIMIGQMRVMGLADSIDHHKKLKLRRLRDRISAVRAGMEASYG